MFFEILENVVYYLGIIWSIELAILALLFVKFYVNEVANENKKNWRKS